MATLTSKINVDNIEAAFVIEYKDVPVPVAFSELVNSLLREYKVHRATAQERFTLWVANDSDEWASERVLSLSDESDFQERIGGVLQQLGDYVRSIPLPRDPKDSPDGTDPAVHKQLREYQFFSADSLRVSKSESVGPPDIHAAIRRAKQEALLRSQFPPSLLGKDNSHRIEGFIFFLFF